MIKRRAEETLANAARAMTVTLDRRPTQTPALIRETTADEVKRPQPVERVRVVRSSNGDKVTHGALARDIRSTLHSRASLRQAILLTEILGPPKALRQTE